jgi:lysophospholipase L1-like esterase
MRRFTRAVAVTGTLAAFGCSSPTQPTPVPPSAPTLTCPGSQQALAHNGTLPSVSFDTPVAQGGAQPVTVSCSPASGSQFQLGETSVTCTATDQQSRTATCAFSVSVAQVPQISATKFVAFGDSLTEGTTSPDPTILVVDNPASYPSQLQGLLSARYQDQTIVVLNEGKGGQHVMQDVGRLDDVLRADNPEVLLLLHGANDLNDRQGAAIPTIIGGLEHMINDAQGHGARVFVATLPPQNPAGSRGKGAQDLPHLNSEIVKMAADEGATLVDLYRGFGTYVGYIGVDGLHPTPAGYQKMAEIWRDALQAALERQGPPPTILPIRPGGAPVRTTRR